MNYLNWILDLFRITIKTNPEIAKSPVCDLIVDMVCNMDNAKLRYLTATNRKMGIK